MGSMHEIARAAIDHTPSVRDALVDAKSELGL
jgi:hypothetical protein